MSDWPIITVAKLVEEGVLERPMDGNHGEIHPKTADFVPSGIPFIMASDLVGGRVDLEGCAFITRAQADTLRKGFAQAGDVLLSHKATIGRTAIVQDNDFPFLVLTPQVTYYRVKDKSRLSPRYLRAYFDSREFQDIFGAWAGAGSTRAYLGITAQLKLPIRMPPIQVQNAIAESVAPLDAKIELNLKTNDTLDALARAIFRDWFVDFGPTRAKLEGQDAYLAREVWSLFPDRLSDEAIPEGWGRWPLDKAAEFLNGLALQKYPAADGPWLPVIKIAQLRAGHCNASERASADLPKQYAIDDGDILFSWSGSLLHRVWAGGAGALNQHLFKVTPLGVPRWFVYYWIDQHMPEFRRIAASKATTMGHIQRHHLTAAMTVFPTEGVLARADEVVTPLFERMHANNLENRQLAELREFLLPKLMSGAVQVRDSEHAEGAVS